jgi:hypothetical protein
MNREHPMKGTEIGPDVPLRLDVAAEIAFPLGGMTVSGLRNEVRRGRLVIERIAGKDFVTLNAIEEMRKKCRDDQQKARDSGCNPNAKKKAGECAVQHGSSETTDRFSSAQAALEKTARELKERSKRTSAKSKSQPSTRRKAEVIPIKPL